MNLRIIVGDREINWAIFPLFILKLVVYVIWCACSVILDGWNLAGKLWSHLLSCAVEIYTELKDLGGDYLNLIIDQESRDSSDSDSETEYFDRETWRAKFGPGNPEELYEIFFDEDFKLTSSDIRKLQADALERQKKQRFQRDFNACLMRERQLAEMTFTLGTLTLFKNYILEASLDILCLLLLISWYFVLWKALLFGTVVHFTVVHFRLLKFFACNASKKF